MRQNQRGSVLWKWWGNVESRYAIPKGKQAVVVLGFPRSGTSIVSRMVEATGVSFGDKGAWRKPDARNPNGFYEYAEAIEIDHALVKQSGLTSPFTPPRDHELRAKGFLNRLRRLRTRKAMMKHLYALATHTASNLFAIKEFPYTFHFWLPYLSRPKIVAVFRNPITNAFSVTRSFKRMAFAQSLESWTHANEELLYHVSTQDSILICMEDLRDATERARIVEVLVKHIGMGDTKHILAAIEENTPTEKDIVLEKNFPLPQRTHETYQALLKLKI